MTIALLKRIERAERKADELHPPANPEVVKALLDWGDEVTSAFDAYIAACPEDLQEQVHARIQGLMLAWEERMLAQQDFDLWDLIDSDLLLDYIVRFGNEGHVPIFDHMPRPLVEWFLVPRQKDSGGHHWGFLCCGQCGLLVPTDYDSPKHEGGPFAVCPACSGEVGQSLWVHSMYAAADEITPFHERIKADKDEMEVLLDAGFRPGQRLSEFMIQWRSTKDHKEAQQT